MSDKRETIMAAVFAALQTVASDGGSPSVSSSNIDRNGAQDLEVEQRPALRMWDGDEAGATREVRPVVRKANVSVIAQPAIGIYVEGVGAGAGSAANALLVRVRKAIWNNSTLAAALGADATISQESIVQDLAPATKTQATLILTLSIPYEFNPADP